MNTANARVLVVEDNFVLLRVIQFNLVHAGFDVTSAANGRQAIEYLTNNSYDLLITDYQMPECDGEAVCDFVRNTLHDDKLQIFLCSAKVLELDVSQMQERWQLSGVFYKPFSVRDMIARIRQALPADSSSSAPILVQS